MSYALYPIFMIIATFVVQFGATVLGVYVGMKLVNNNKKEK